MAVVVSLVCKPAHLPSRPPERYTREPLTEATLLAGHGIAGDRKGGKGDRHINLMAAETLEQMRAEGFRTGPGEMGEQVVVSGLDLAALKPGERLRLGGNAVLCVVKPRTGCQRFREVQGQPLTGTTGRLGLMLTVEAGGVVRVGDPVEVLR